MDQHPDVDHNLPVLASRHDISLFGYQSGEWIDAETLGAKLGYEQPRKFLNNLFNRYKKRFKPDESIVLKLKTMVHPKNGDKPYNYERETRLFSVPAGALRLCMLSKAPNALDVHDEILDLFQTRQFSKALEMTPANQEIPLTESHIHEIKRRLGPKDGNRIVKAMLLGNYDHSTYIMPIEEIARLSDGAITAAAVKEEAKRRGCSPMTVYRKVQRLREAFGIDKKPTRSTGLPRRTRSDKGKTKRPAGHPMTSGKNEFGSLAG
ncbi:MAG: hypothetical protein GXX82_05945 [Syntrophorhabdus sp.]|nr:hypothetical protein [Syntrophorhabdus sp.]